MNPYEPPQLEGADRAEPSAARALVAILMASGSIVLAIWAVISSQITYANLSHAHVIAAAFLIALLALVLALWSRLLVKATDSIVALILSALAVGCLGFELAVRSF